MQCTSCHATNHDTASFCGSCGSALVAPVESGLLDRTTDSTRYLCAAVHLDSVLSERVTREILDEEFRSPPWSPGVDLELVARHALAARSRQLVRDVALTVTVVGMLYSLATFPPAALVWLVLAWVVVVFERLVTTYTVIARQLGPARSDSQVSRPLFGAETESRLEALRDLREANVTVYGSYSPFVGSGVTVDAWSFAIDLDRSTLGRHAETFAVADLHTWVTDSLADLALPRLTLQDRVFVDGRDVRDDKRFLGQHLARPFTYVDPRLVTALKNAPDDHARTYLCVRVEGWRGQLVQSIFLRFLVTSNKLFVELSRSVLAPVIDRYQEADRLLPRPTLRQLARLMGRCLWELPRRLWHAPASVLRGLFAPLSDRRRRRRRRAEIRSGLRYNYGATLSPREYAADSSYQRYFQKLDQELYEKVIERQVLKALVDFLDERGIDTSELVERQTTILNSGIYIAGGTNNVGSMAAGKKARAKTRGIKTPGPLTGAETRG